MNPQFDFHLTNKPIGCSVNGSCTFVDFLAAIGPAGSALIGGGAAILAYLLKVVVEGCIELRRREKRRLECLRALRADVKDTIQKMGATYATAKSRDDMKEKFQTALLTGEKHIPFIVSTPDDMLWEIVKTELTGLKSVLLEDITGYYYANSLFSERCKAVQTDAYANLSIQRQEGAVLKLYVLAPKIVEIGKAVVHGIDIYEREHAFRWTIYWSSAFTFLALAIIGLNRLIQFNPAR